MPHPPSTYLRMRESTAHHSRRGVPRRGGLLRVGALGHLAWLAVGACPPFLA